MSYFDDKVLQFQQKIVGNDEDGLQQLFNVTVQYQSKPLAVEMLRHAYAEVNQRNITPMFKVLQFIEYEFVNSNYEQSRTFSAQNANDRRVQQNPPRLLASELVKCINLIIQHHNSGLYDDIDEILIELLRQVHSYLFFLKKNHPKLPLHELQFCIEILLKIRATPQYRFVMNKVLLMQFLTVVRDEISKWIPFETYSQYVKYLLQTFRIPKHFQCMLRRDSKNFKDFFGRWLHEDSFDNLPVEYQLDLQSHYKKGIDSRSLEEVISFEEYCHYVKNFLQTLNITHCVRGTVGKYLKQSKTALDLSNNKVCLKDPSPEIQAWLKSSYSTIIVNNSTRAQQRKFKKLYDTYYIIKQYYSIEKILWHLKFIPDKNAGSISPLITTSAINRMLQKIGETIKSTSNTPNITKKLDRILKQLISPTIADCLKDLRQFLSHGFSLEKLEIEKEIGSFSHLSSLFQATAENLREVRHWFQYTQALQCLYIYRRFFGYLLSFKSIDKLKNCIKFVGAGDFSRLETEYDLKYLMEARECLENILENSSSTTTNPLLTGSACVELKTLLETISERIKSINVDQTSIKTSMDQNALLLNRIIVPSEEYFDACIVARDVLSITTRPTRYNLFQKIDYESYCHLLTRLKYSETNEERRKVWDSLHQRLARNNFDGINALSKQMDQRPDAALDATIETMQQLGLPLDDQDFLQFVNQRLCNSYYHNVFLLDNKYRVLKEIVKDSRAKVTFREARARLRELRRADETLLQQQYERLQDRLKYILSYWDLFEIKVVRNLSQTEKNHYVKLAVEYYLLQLSEILCALGIFRGNVHELVSLVPVVTGRNLRNYLAHDELTYAIFTKMPEIVFTNAMWLIQNQIKLYQSVQNQRSTATSQLEPADLNAIYAKRMEWTEHRMNFFQLVKQFNITKLQEYITEHCQAGADLLLLQKTCDRDDVLKIAENAHPSRYIADMLQYCQSNDNFFYVVLTNTQCYYLKNRINKLITSPYINCFTVALRHGLWDEITDIFPKCEKDMADCVLSWEFSKIMNWFPIAFIKKLMNLVPSSWLIEVNDKFGNTILHWAVLRGDKELLQLVLERYGNLGNVVNILNDTPLQLAKRYYDQKSAVVEMLETFSSNRSIVSVIEDLGNNPLRVAIEGSDMNKFRQLQRQMFPSC